MIKLIAQNVKRSYTSPVSAALGRLPGLPPGGCVTIASRTTFIALLEEAGVLVADGGMGSLLLDHGLEPGESPELLNVEQPQVIARVHEGYVDAGADIILTNTFGGTVPRMAHFGLEERVPELNRAAVTIARQVSERSGREVAVAGSVGPTGQLFAPLGPLDAETAVGFFAEQVRALSGVDLIWIETMSSVEELTAAYRAAVDTGLPVVTTMSFDTKGHTMMGVPPGHLADWASGESHPPAAIGANCGIGTVDVVQAVAEMHRIAPNMTLVAKANCGLPEVGPESIEYPEQPSDMTAYVQSALQAGARIIGACCGSSPAHIAAIRDAIDRSRA